MSRPTARNRTIVATDAEWERVTELARAAGEDVGRFVVRRAISRESIPATVLRQAVRQVLILAKLEEQRIADLGADGRLHAVSDAVDAWLEREDEFAHLADPGAANRWKALKHGGGRARQAETACPRAPRVTD